MAEIVIVDGKPVLDDLQLLKARFFRKIRVLKALLESVEDAYYFNEATEKHCNMLQTELEELSVLRERYEGEFDVFQRSRVGSQFPQEVSVVSKELSEDVVAYIALKTRVIRILCKIHDKEDNITRSLSSQIDAHESTDQEEQDLPKIVNSAVKEEEKVVEASSFRCLMSLVIGVVIILVFYFGLGLVIYFAQQNSNANAVGKANFSIYEFEELLAFCQCLGTIFFRKERDR